MASAPTVLQTDQITCLLVKTSNKTVREQTRKAIQLNRVKKDAFTKSPNLSFWPCVTLTFDPLTPKVACDPSALQHCNLLLLVCVESRDP